MSDQAAAEALVAVGRIGVSPPGGANDDSDGEADQPKKKRTRRSAKTSRVDKEEDVLMDGEDEDEPSASAPPLRERKRRGGANGWNDGRSGSPHRGGVPPARSDSYLARGGVVLPSPRGHVGFELAQLAQLNGTFLGHASAPPSSYIRSGSNAPSRTHSPLGPAGSGAGAGGAPSGPGGATNVAGAPGAGYAHPHGHLHALPPGMPGHYYAGPPPSEMSSLMVAAGVALGGLGIPSYMDLERHYFELGEQKRKWEEMMERTDRLMAGMKRTLDEMRGLVAQGVVGSPVHHGQPPQQGQQQQQQPGSQHQSPQMPTASPVLPAAGAASVGTPTTAPSAAAGTPAVPLNRTDKERSGPSIWPVAADASGAAGKP